MTYIENIVVGKPLVDLKDIFGINELDWEENEFPKTHFTDERNLAVILKDIGVVPSISEVRRNKPELVKVLDKPDYFEFKWGKKRFFVLVGE